MTIKLKVVSKIMYGEWAVMVGFAPVDRSMNGRADFNMVVPIDQEGSYSINAVYTITVAKD
jgi:hypothetical protein